jgi:hypothetical protein
VLRQLDLRRRRRLLRIVSLGVMGLAIVLIPGGLIPTVDIFTLIAVCIALVSTVIAYFLNSYYRVIAGGFTLLGGLSLAIAWEIVVEAHIQTGLDLVNLRFYDLFALPICLSGVLISRRGPVVIGTLTSLFTVISLIVLPKSPELLAYWNGTYKDAVPGSAYDVIAVALVIQVLVAIASWLGADSVRRALLDAARADELAAANEHILAQTRLLEMQRQRLHDGIAHLQHVHAAVSRGQWDARATISEGELLPVALSLNLLIDRLSRVRADQEQRARLDAASRELALALRRVRAGEPYMPPGYTGTPFDEVLVELARLRTTVAVLAPAQHANGTAIAPLAAPSPVRGGSIPSQPTGAIHVPGAAPLVGSAEQGASLADTWPDIAESGGGDALPPWLRGSK